MDRWKALVTALLGFLVIALLRLRSKHLSSRTPDPKIRRSRSGREIWRVQGIPVDFDKAQLIRALRDHPDLHCADDHNGAEVLTLALGFGASKSKQVATVTFKNLPSRLSAGHEVVINLAQGDSKTISAKIDNEFEGATVLTSPTAELKDSHSIMFISGLGGHPIGSFMNKDSRHLWLTDDLPGDRPSARIITYGYKTHMRNKKSFAEIEHLGENLHHVLRDALDQFPQPLILVAHSLGGLLVEEALSIMSEDTEKMALVSGVIFFGVPHRGIDIKHLLPMVDMLPSQPLVHSLDRISSRTLERLRGKWQDVLDKTTFKVFCFYETVPSPTAMWCGPERGWRIEGQEAVLVDEGSATDCLRKGDQRPKHRFALDKSHSDLVKFGPNDPTYQRVLSFMAQASKEGVRFIESTKEQQCPTQVQLSQKQQDCLKSLAFPKMDDRSHNIDHAVAGTCSWLLQHERYKSWAARDQKLLWIRGKPGSGKSTLLKFALKNHPDTSSVKRHDLVMSYFFHGRGDDLQKTKLGFLRSLVHQLLSKAPTVMTKLVDKFKRNCDTIGDPGIKWEWNEKELAGFFEESLPMAGEHRSVWLFVDALDESGEENAAQLFRWLKVLTSSSDLRLYICFSCRNYPIISRDFDFVICPDEENRNDIITYIEAQLSESDELFNSIGSLITESASGVFLWARLVVEQALTLDRQGKGLKKIRQMISHIPPELDDIYGRLVEGTVKQNGKRKDETIDEIRASLTLIRWICFATRPLTLAELRWAMAVEPICAYSSLKDTKQSELFTPDDEELKRRVYTISWGLIEVLPTSNIVQFIHQSAKDFFLDKGLMTLEKGLSALDDSALSIGDVAVTAHRQLSRTCMRYLATSDVKEHYDQTSELRWTGTSTELDGGSALLPLLRYALGSWKTHLKRCDSPIVSQDDVVVLFHGQSYKLWNSWTKLRRVYGYDEYAHGPDLGSTELAHEAANLGLLGVLRSIVQDLNQFHSGCLHATDDQGQTPLYWASVKGHLEVARLLLDKGTDVGAADKYGQTPLYWASRRGHLEVARLLLDKGADVGAADNDGRTPLYWASRRGHLEVARLLLDRGADVGAADKYGWTPLYVALRQGHLEVARLLLDRGADVGAADKYGWTPLYWALRQGHLEVARLLLDRGADVGAADNDGQTPLHMASVRGHLEVARLLLDKGADVGAADNDGQTPLHMASVRGHLEVARLLLDKGADVGAADKYGWTPLYWALRQGHLEVARLLLDKGVKGID